MELVAFGINENNGNSYSIEKIFENGKEFIYDSDQEFTCNRILTKIDKMSILCTNRIFIEFFRNMIRNLNLSTGKKYKFEKFLYKERFYFNLNRFTEIRIPLRDENGDFRRIDVSTLMDKTFSYFPRLKFTFTTSIKTNAIYVSIIVDSLIITKCEKISKNVKQIDRLKLIENTRDFSSLVSLSRTLETKINEEKVDIW